MRSKEKEFPQAGFRINVQSFACFWMEMQTNKEQFENQKKKKKTSNILFVPHMVLNFWINKYLCGNCHIHVGDGLLNKIFRRQVPDFVDRFDRLGSKIVISLFLKVEKATLSRDLNSLNHFLKLSQTAGNQLIKHHDSINITVVQVTILFHFHFWQFIILCLLKVCICFQSLVRLFQLVAFYDHFHQILHRLHTVCFF